MKTPDITPAQVVAVVGSVIAIIVAAGLPLSAALQESILDLVMIVAPIIIGADGLIRVGRAVSADKIATARNGADSDGA